MHQYIHCSLQYVVNSIIMSKELCISTLSSWDIVSSCMHKDCLCVAMPKCIPDSLIIVSGVLAVCKLAYHGLKYYIGVCSL